MEDQELYPTLIEKLAKDFALNKNNLLAQFDLEAIRVHLINRVAELMSRDYDRFLNSLYRIDISETKVQEAMRNKDKTRIPEKLADLIIERQMLRVKTQMMYKQGKL